MKPARVAALIVGCLLVLPGLGMLIGGTALSLAYAFGRDDDGYFDATLDDFESDTAAITVSEDLVDDPGPPDWLFELIDAEIRVRATATDSDTEIFIGIAEQDDLEAYLDGVRHDEIAEFDGLTPEFDTIDGDDAVAAPTEQEFWVVESGGTGTQEIEWEVEGGHWGAALMNADGSPGISAEVNLGAKSGVLLLVAILILSMGWIVSAGAVLLIVYGAKGLGSDSDEPPPATPGPSAAPVGAVPVGAVPVEADAPLPAPTRGPLVLTATLDPGLSRWQWLVKWFLAIPHWIVLFFLWLAFMLLTFIAGFAILFTGRYPRGMFDFNVGVLRWTWRVTYYAATGGVGTDQYPPFSLDLEPDYPATLDVRYPEQLSRGLVLVKWWLLAIPHYLILGAVMGSSYLWVASNGEDSWIWVSSGGGLLGALVLVAVIALLFTGRYPRGLFDLVIGLNRWIFRVAAYATLMTDDYPPFRLDQGGNEPDSSPADLEGGPVTF